MVLNLSLVGVLKLLFTKRAILLLFILLVLGSTIFLYLYNTPKARALRRIDTIIVKIQNPDYQLISKYDIDPGIMENRKEVIIEGLETPGYKVPGLNDIRQSLGKNQRTEAKERLVKVFDSFHPFGSRTGEDTDLVEISKEELEKLDPNHVFAPGGGLRSVTALYKEEAVEIIKVYYSFK